MQHPLDRALTILAAACPQLSRNELASLSVSRRDALLFAVRRQLNGAQLAGLHHCPACREQLTFNLDGQAVYAAPDMDEGEPVYEFAADEYALQFRLPNSFDLAHVAACDEVAAARTGLLRSCVLRLTRGDEEVAVEDVPDAVTEAVAAEMARQAPQADVELDVQCAACGHRWPIVFDIASFFWTEISARAKRLLREVHTLARAYGWRETDILALSPARRQFYLEMVS